MEENNTAVDIQSINKKIEKESAFEIGRASCRERVSTLV